MTLAVRLRGSRPWRMAAPFPERFYADYVQRERLDEFAALLRYALDQGYEPMTLTAFAECATARPPTDDSRILLVRHDIDSDVSRARQIWRIERRLGVIGTYFFRRSTWDLAFMRELSSAGYEVGYHYEELATEVKKRGAATADEARRLLTVARAQLLSNVADLRATSGLALDVFASHGDFANRAVEVSNVELLADPIFRSELGVRLEAYDIEENVSARAADGHTLPGWWPEDPADALRSRERVVEVLIHPRSWGAAPLVNARADLHRVREGCLYRIRCAGRRA